MFLAITRVEIVVHMIIITNIIILNYTQLYTIIILNGENTSHGISGYV